MDKLRLWIYSNLRSSERFFKTDMVYVAKGGFWLTAGQFVVALSAFILSVAFANLWPAETLGNYRYVLSLASILSIPTLSGLNTSISQAVARNLDGSIKEAFHLKLKWGVLGSLASLAIALYYYIDNNHTLALSFLIISPFIPLMEGFLLYDSYLRGKKLFKESTIYNTVTYLVNAAFILITLLYTDNLVAALVAYFLSWTIMRAIYWYLTQRKFKFNSQFDSQTISYGKHLSLMVVIGTVVSALDRLLLFHFAGPVNLAVYTIATSPVLQIQYFAKNISSLAFPKLANKNKQDIQNTLFARTVPALVLILIISLVYIVTVPFLYKIFFPNYMNAVLYSQIFSLNLIGYLGAKIFYTALQAQGAQKELYIYNFLSPLVQAVLVVVLTVSYGLIGTVTAIVASHLANALLAGYLVKRM